MLQFYTISIIFIQKANDQTRVFLYKFISLRTYSLSTYLGTFLKGDEIIWNLKKM